MISLRDLVIGALIAVALTHCISPFAAETDGHRVWVTPGAVSYHTDRSRNFNERNAGGGAEWELDREHAIVAGTYRNSIRQDSRYVGYRWTPLAAGPVRAGLLLGAVDGYLQNSGNPVPFVMPALLAEFGPVGVMLTAWPSIEKQGVSGGVALQLRVRVW